MVKKDYVPYFYRDPLEAEFFEKVFRDPKTGLSVKTLFEGGRKGPIIDVEMGKIYTLSDFQDYLKDKYGLSDRLASAVYTYLELTIIRSKKPEYAIHKIANKIRESQKDKIGPSSI